MHTKYKENKFIVEKSDEKKFYSQNELVQK